MLSALRRYLGDPVATWRTGSPQSQVLTLGVLLVGVGLCFVVSVVSYALMPLTSYYVWLLLGMLLLRFRPLLWLCGATTAAALTAVLLDPPMTAARVTAVVSMMISLGLILFQSSRQQSGLPGPMSEAIFADLRDRLRSQSTIPALPAGWSSQAALVAAHGSGYGGDFMVANLTADQRSLELILVDVTGKGVPAASRALQFGGALGGLLGALPPQGLFGAANDFLLRQSSDEMFATAVHAVVDLETGRYHLTSAGHPPPLVWSDTARRWTPDTSEGTALGIVSELDMQVSVGVLHPGEALLLYTDGMVETRTSDLDTGIAWLQEEASRAVQTGFDGAARRIVGRLDGADDDRALVILHRAH